MLHRAPRGKTKLSLTWLRKDERHQGTLELAEGWRATNLGWRKSVAEAAIGAHPGFPWPLGVNANDRKKFGIADDAMAVRAYYPKGPKGPAGEAGLRGDLIITAVNGESPNVISRPFMVWFRLRFDPGDPIELTVVDAKGEKQTVGYAAQ